MPDPLIQVMSDEVSIRLTRDEFRLRNWGLSVSPGVAHFTVQLDGREHLYSSTPGSEVKTSYRAQREGDAVVVAKHVFSPSKDFGSYVERWSLTEAGRKLTVSTEQGQTTYKRPPFLRSLFRASP